MIVIIGDGKDVVYDSSVHMAAVACSLEAEIMLLTMQTEEPLSLVPEGMRQKPFTWVIETIALRSAVAVINAMRSAAL